MKRGPVAREFTNLVVYIINQNRQLRMPVVNVEAPAKALPVAA